MAELERHEEIEGRLAEMEYALAALTERPRALRYLGRELQGLLAECRQQTASWSAVLEHAEMLAARVAEDRRQAGEV